MLRLGLGAREICNAPTLLCIRSRSIHYFDKYQFAKRLEETGLTKEQSQAAMTALSDVIQSSVQSIVQTSVTKAESEKQVYMYKSDFADLKNELYMLEKNDFAILKAENERLQTELERMKLKIKEEINKLQGSVRLDMNLEKSRVKDDTQEQDAKIQQTSNKIDTEVSNLRGHLETLKFDIIKYIVGTIASVAAIFLGYLRLIK